MDFKSLTAHLSKTLPFWVYHLNITQKWPTKVRLPGFLRFPIPLPDPAENRQVNQASASQPSLHGPSPIWEVRSPGCAKSCSRLGQNCGYWWTPKSWRTMSFWRICVQLENWNSGCLKSQKTFMWDTLPKWWLVVAVIRSFKSLNFAAMVAFASPGTFYKEASLKGNNSGRSASCPRQVWESWKVWCWKVAFYRWMILNGQPQLEKVARKLRSNAKGFMWSLPPSFTGACLILMLGGSVHMCVRCQNLMSWQKKSKDLASRS